MVLYKPIKKRSSSGRPITYIGILEATDKKACTKCGKEARVGSLFRIEKIASETKCGQPDFKTTGKLFCIECADLLDVSGVTIEIRQITKKEGD
jgi:hypothetical protein